MSEERPETQEGFGEASLGEAQSSDPPPDPEMLEDDDGTEGEGEADAPAEDPGAGPASTQDELDPGGERDQAEG